MKSASHSAILSLVVPVFNVEDDLCECLDSIVHQTFKNIEIICVDDGSCDSSPEILRKYAERDSRIKIITQKNQGLSSARNTGVNASRGKYLMFIDSDDYLSPNACELMVQKILSCDDLAFVSSGTELLWEYEVSEDYKRGKNVYFSKKLNICLNKTIYTPSSPNVLTLPYKEISEKKPLKIRFFGNLGLGRWQVLQKIALALSELNEGSFKAKLEVYSSSSDSNIINALSIPNACSFMGWTYGAEYLYLLQDADIVVHAESFMPENIKKTWMSVSTKIADYLGAGKCILAVGPSEIASISHLRNVSFIIDNIKNLKDELYKLISDYDIRQDLHIKAREFANKEHNSKIIDLKIKESILQCLDKA